MSRRIGEFSPETFEAQWLGGARGPQVGARFRGHVQAQRPGPGLLDKCTVVASEPGREFAFAVGAPVRRSRPGATGSLPARTVLT